MSNNRRLPWGQRLQAAASILTNGAVAAGRYGPSVSAADWNSRFTAPDHAHVTPDTALAVSAVYSCVGLLSDSIAQCPAHVLSRDGDTREPESNHHVQKLLRGNVNDFQQRRGFLKTLETNRQLTGNGYAQIERDATGAPVGLWPLNAAPRRNAQGRLVYQAGADELAPRDVIHIRGLSQDGLVGVSPIGAARNAIVLAAAAERFGSKYFSNESKSGGYIIQPVQTNTRSKRQQQDNVSASDMDGQGGPANAHKPKILDPGVKFLPTTIPPNEAQFLETRAIQVAEISRLYRVPLVLLDSAAATAWGSGIEQLMIAFIANTIAPLAQDWEAELSAKLLTDAERADGLYIRLDLRALMRGDMQARASFYQSAIQNSWMTPNEVRAREELPPLPGGDQAFRPLNMAPSNDNG